MVAIITQSVFALKKIQKPVIVTREEGNLCVYRKDPVLKAHYAFLYKATTFPESPSLGKVLMVPAQLPDLC